MMFTDRYIRNLKPEGKLIDIGEKNGFGIRIRPDGCKIWFYRYVSPVTRVRRFKVLGEYPELSLEKARIKYGTEFKSVKAGIDPMEVAHHEQEERRKAPTVKALCEDYLERHAKRFKKSWAQDERVLHYDIIPAWGTRKAADIKKRDVVLVLEKIVDRNAPGMANNTFRIIRKMFNWAVEQDILPFTPCFGVKLPAPKVSRDRVLTETEIKSLWENLEHSSISLEIRRALKLILVTAQRPGEVIGMHTSEIEGNWWTISADRAKNGKAHRVFLTQLAQEIIAAEIQEVKRIREIPTDVDYKGFIFPCPIKKKVQSMDGQALVVAVSRNLAFPQKDMDGKPLCQDDGKLLTENKLGPDKFTPHDLRRTAATFMAQSGEMDEVIDAVLSHAKTGIIKVYNQYRYDKEKQSALESWSRKLISLTTTKDLSNVISFQQARG